MDAPTQAFVAQQSERVEGDDRLKDGADQVLVKHLAEVLARLQDAQRKHVDAAFGAEGRGAVPELKRLPAKPKFLLGDMDDVAAGQGRLNDAPAIDVGAIG